MLCHAMVVLYSSYVVNGTLDSEEGGCSHVIATVEHSEIKNHGYKLDEWTKSQCGR